MDNKKTLINKIYDISIIVFTILLGFFFILCTFTIYFNGKEIKETINPTHQIYTKEIITKYLNYLFIPFLLWFLLIICGAIINYLTPFNKKKITKPDEIETYFRLKNKINLNDEAQKEHILIIDKERKNRKLGFLIISLVSILLMIFPARYLFNFSNFTTNEISAKDEAIKMVINVFPFIIISFILFGVYLVYYTKSIKKELVEIKEVLKKSKPLVEQKINKDNSLLLNITRISVGVIGIIFVILGILNGGVEDVLVKAINICTECIGLA